MSYPNFPPAAVGICPSTLMADSRTKDTQIIQQVLRACAGAGFPSLSLGAGHALALGLGSARQLLDGLGLQVRAIEAAIGWAAGPEQGREEMKNLLEIADALGADMFLATTISPSMDPDRAREGLAAACEEAARHGVRLAMEFIPGTAMPDLATAWGLARDCGAANAGVIIDVLHWHHQPGGPAFDVLQAIPPERIHYVQLCDSEPGPAPQGGEYIPYAMTRRALPGEGVADIPALLSALDAMAAAPYVAVEAFNQRLVAAGPDAMAARLRDSVDNILR